MDRIIKFRAWDMINKRMTSSNIGVDFEKKICHLFDEHFRGSPSMIDDFVLLQFTGVYDKNGKEIYEGDIVQSSPILFESDQRAPTQLYIVKFFEGSYCLGYKSSRYGVPIFPFNTIHEIEVIGNIYENPELLEMIKND